MTVHHIFESGIIQRESISELAGMVVEYEGKFYEIGSTHKEYQMDKVWDEDYYILTLAVLAKKLKGRGVRYASVIPANSGRMVKESSITSTFKAFCNYTGVEYKPSHTCRRSYVTNCLDKGMKPALVSKNVGHKNKSTTLNPYYKCKNDCEDNLTIQNEIFKIYDFDFGGGGQAEAMFA